MKKLLASLTLAIAAFGMVGGTASAAAVPHHYRVLATETGGIEINGMYWEPHNALPITIVVSDSPRQPVFVEWSLGCTRRDGTEIDRFTTHDYGPHRGGVVGVYPMGGGNFPGPVTKVVKMPAGAYNCGGTLNAMVEGSGVEGRSGSVKVTVEQ